MRGSQGASPADQRLINAVNGGVRRSMRLLVLLLLL